jgi:hypothetical protein
MTELAPLPFFTGNVMKMIDYERSPSTVLITTAFDTLSRELSARGRRRNDVQDTMESDMSQWVLNTRCRGDGVDSWMVSSLFRLLGLLGWFACEEGGARIRSQLEWMRTSRVKPTIPFVRVLLKCLQSLPRTSDHLELLRVTIAFIHTHGITHDEYMDSIIVSLWLRQGEAKK